MALTLTLSLLLLWLLILAFSQNKQVHIVCKQHSKVIQAMVALQ